ncbi:unnamed protein product [Phytophthora fragariaefolia]|uniref:Unnamed protein product n=1 Tax=Phytophthora fragariaefolia TaxID=1490495 RepID=A0A9W6TUX1_9STRA|nr:unnamed protein product [Phytophthora fragariaefolia]
MRAKYAWNLVLALNTEKQLDSFLEGQNGRPKQKIQPEICQVCPVNLDIHPMRYIIFKCDSHTCKKTCTANWSGSKCPWRLKALACDVNDESRVYQHNSHASAAPSSQKPDQLNLMMQRFVVYSAESGTKPTNATNDMILAFGLQGVVDRKLLRNVQNCVRTYHRKTLHDNDYIDEMVELASTRRFRESMGDTSAFAFGFDFDEKNGPILGQVEGDDPLVIGFATKSSILNLGDASNFVLHLDATFELNSRGHPVVVIGLSDM